MPVLLEAGLALGGEVASVVHHLQLPEDAPAGQDVHDVVQDLDLLNQDSRSENYNWASEWRLDPVTLHIELHQDMDVQNFTLGPGKVCHVKFEVLNNFHLSH